MSQTTVEMFEAERRGHTLIVTPTVDLGSLDYEQIKENGGHVLRTLETTGIRDVVIDLGRISYFSSSAIAFFGSIWEVINKSGGQMVFCNLNSEEANLLRITKLNTLWRICRSLDEALAVVADRECRTR